MKNSAASTYSLLKRRLASCIAAMLLIVLITLMARGFENLPAFEHLARFLDIGSIESWLARRHNTQL